jgi:hypothetical protein
VGICREDQDSLRVLWLRDASRPPAPDNVVVYRFTRLVMGASPSPAILELLLQYHLHHLPAEDAELAKRMERNLYVDNLFLLGNDPEAMQGWSRRACEIFEDCRMNLREFLSNNPTTIQAIDPVKLLPRELTKTLGVWWDPVADTYTIKFATGGETVTTPRQLLGLIARTFDLLGWLIPVLLGLKLLQQKVPVVKPMLDKPLVPEVLEELHTYLAKLDLPAITIPRFVPVEGPWRLHLFADASRKAMAVAAYLVGPTRARLLMARSRVKPADWGNPGESAAKSRVLREITPATPSPSTPAEGEEKEKEKASQNDFSPRLELASIELATRLLDYLLRMLDLPMVGPHTIWNDNEVALWWIVGVERKPAFVENRVRKIRQVPNLQVRYVPTRHNPADTGTRPTTPSELQANHLSISSPRLAGPPTSSALPGATECSPC